MATHHTQPHRKRIRVSYLADGTTIKPYIRMSGNYLSQYGFNAGDYVHVTVQDNKITIQK